MFSGQLQKHVARLIRLPSTILRTPEFDDFERLTSFIVAPLFGVFVVRLVLREIGCKSHYRPTVAEAEGLVAVQLDRRRHPLG
jgi:hypothetical protein